MSEENNHIIDITGCDHAVIFKALYDNAKPFGYGIAVHRPGNISIEDARRILENQTHFDYVCGRLMKVTIEGNTLDPRLYDRDYGQGTTERLIMKACTKPNNT